MKIKNYFNRFVKKAVVTSSLIGAAAYLINQNKITNKFNKIHCRDIDLHIKEDISTLNLIENLISNKQPKIFIPNKAIITIIYDNQNELQTELTNIILDKLEKDFVSSLNESDKSKIIIEKISIQSDSKILEKNKLENSQIENKNEPIVIIKNDYLIEKINPYSFSSNSNIKRDKFKTKLNNLISYKRINSLREAREEFRYLESPKNKIIIVTTEILNNSEFQKSISLFRQKNTKILMIEDKRLQEVLSLEENKIYQYYPAKLPYKMKDTDLFLKEFYSKQTGNENINAHEILAREGIDLNAYLNTNSTSLMLKMSMFRDEIKLSEDLLNREQIKGQFYLEERIRLQKLISYPTRNVTRLAETDKKLIQSGFNQPNKHNVFIYIPTWAVLKESIFDALLFESPHLFDNIQITNSRNFTFKNELYDDTQISEDIPQIYIVETDDSKNKIYSMNYFRFADDFNKYLRNKKEAFSKPEFMENLTYVTTVNSKNFEDKILKPPPPKEFMLEIKHEGCPTCYMLGKMLDHVSQKFKKHKYDKKLKFFRVDTHNDLPFLGEFAATPTYLFCRKNNKGEITFISQVEKQEFLFKIKKLSSHDFSKVRYHPNIGFGFYLFQRNEFLKPNYDPDIDLSGFTV